MVAVLILDTISNVFAHTRSSKDFRNKTYGATSSWVKFQTEPPPRAPFFGNSLVCNAISSFPCGLLRSCICWWSSVDKTRENVGVGRVVRVGLGLFGLPRASSYSTIVAFTMMRTYYILGGGLDAEDMIPELDLSSAKQARKQTADRIS